MSTIQIETLDQQRRFRPGALVEGAIFWDFDEAPKSAEVRLFWFTRGRGDEDVEIADVMEINGAGAGGQQAFRLQLPTDGPLSFSGRLITLTWAVEAVFEPGGRMDRLEIDVTPWDEDIVLDKIAEPGRKKSPFHARR